MFPLFFLFVGCSNSRQELIESELRRKELELAELRAHLGGRDAEIQTLEIELEMLQRCQAKEARKGPLSLGGGAVLLVERITLGRLTGGIRQNEQVNGDDTLQVLLEPRDADGSIIKAPGSAKVEVYEVNTQGLKSFLSSWEFSNRELRRLWDDPLIGGPSYRLVMPWKVFPSTENLKVLVRFVTLDGTPFEAEKDITVRLTSRRPRPNRDQCIIPDDILPPELQAAPPELRTLPPVQPPAAPPAEPAPLPTPKPKETESQPPVSAAPPVLRSTGSAEEMLPTPQRLTLPPQEPPVSFELKPFSAARPPIIQASQRTATDSHKGELRPRLGLPVKQRND